MLYGAKKREQIAMKRKKMIRLTMTTNQGLHKLYPPMGSVSWGSSKSWIHPCHGCTSVVSKIEPRWPARPGAGHLSGSIPNINLTTL